jgi:hypothetical protein
MPFPDFRNSRSFFSIRSHKPMSGNFPVNIGVGKSMNICFVVSSAFVDARGVSSIEVCNPGLADKGAPTWIIP